MILAAAHSQEQTDPSWGKGKGVSANVYTSVQKIPNVREYVIIYRLGAPLGCGGVAVRRGCPVPGVAGVTQL